MKTMATNENRQENEGPQPATPFKNNHHRPYITLPRIISIKNDAFVDIPGFLRQLKTGDTGLCVCDRTTLKIAGTLIGDILEDEDLSLEFYEITEADKKTMDDAAGYIEEEGFDFVMGVGGGRPIDIAKTASFNTNTSFISVPTAPSHDGIASNIASILVGKERVSINAHPPHCVVADIGVISQAPYRLVASGCGDVISNTTAILDWKLGRDTRNENYSRYASAISQMSYTILKRNVKLVKPKSSQAAHLVMDALVASGMAMSIYGNSRPASGGEHLISHALDRFSGSTALHGEQCGVATIFTMYLHDGDWKEIKRLLKSVRAPVTLKQLEVTKKEFTRAVQMAPELRPTRFTILHQKLTSERISEVLEETQLVG